MAIQVPSYNFVWQQGEDATINMVYKEGAPAVPIDLTGYSLRMDVRAVGGVTTLYTFNSDDTNPATDDEATFGTQGQIDIAISRAISLPGGALVDSIGQALSFDIFLRNTAGKQKKILKGTITIEGSETLWV